MKDSNNKKINPQELGQRGIPQEKNEAMRKRPLLGERLLDKGIITREQLDIALKAHRKADEYLGETIIDLGFATEDQVLTVLAEQLNIPFVKVSKVSISKDIISKVPARFAYYYKLIPAKFENNTLYVALADPFDVHTLDDLNLLLGHQIKPLLASEKDIVEALKKHYGLGAETVETMIKDPKNNPPYLTKVCEGLFIDEQVNFETEASVTKLVEQIILQAIDDRATDIHFEPSEHHFKVRYRIDGELFDMPVAKNIKKFQDSIINRIKIMASLDIAQSRLPQDGRILVKGNAKPIDLRVSVLPTPWGEGIEIRILPHKMDHQLDSLGMTEADFKKVNLLIHKPHGIILETGPTGSGKTTTLYTFLNEIKNPKKKIITLEDPIEYNIADVLQIQVNPLIGLDFARGLRSILRHDPNILMVGEIRDAETAAIAIRSSITGHLVFSTLHTNSAVDSIARLMDMGIEPYLIASSLEGVIAQRLVRKICPNCKEEYEPAKEILDSLPMTFKLHAKFYKGKGCAECHFSGFSERTAIFETLVIDNKIKEMIVNRAPIEQIRKYAQSIGMKTLREDGLEKAKAGITTLEEVIRVTD